MAKAKAVKGFEGKSVVVRTDRAGAWVGNLISRNGTEAVLENARRLWYWDGAVSLSQLAIDGVSKPENCKFPESVKELLVMGVIEIIPLTDKAVKSINEVAIWKK